MIERGQLKRAGLLATQGIRGSANRVVLERIKQTGDVFWAYSDRDWILDGAAVHVSMIGFDDGSESARELDGVAVARINPDLTDGVDVTQARDLPENRGLGFYGTVKIGPFDIASATAAEMLRTTGNPNGRPNSDVVKPWINAKDITGRSRGMWIVDFGSDMPMRAAAEYEAPFEIVRTHVKPLRDEVNRRKYRETWWLFGEPCSGMRSALVGFQRYIATASTAKHRLFAWIAPHVIPDHAVAVFAREDDYFFGVLHSRIHEVWARAQGTQLRERESGFRYTPTTCFETFPFPWPPGQEPQDDPRVQAIAATAKDLVEKRDRWLNPPEWTKTEVLEFPGTVGGPWDRFIDPATIVARGDVTLGTVRYPKLVPRDEACAKHLAKRTLTNLYNERPTWLDLAHQCLDQAVFASYGWPADLPDEEILEGLLSLNLERAGSSTARPSRAR